MLEYKFRQLENEIRILNILKDYSDKAHSDFIELSMTYNDILEHIKVFKSVECGIFSYKYNREPTHYTLLELNLEERIFKSRCGTNFEFEFYEEILDKVGTSIAILFLIDSNITEIKLRPSIVNNEVIYSNNFGISVPVFHTSIKNIKHLSEFMKKHISNELHNFNGLKKTK